MYVYISIAISTYICRRRPRAANLAGVPWRVGVQREHRRMEHRVSQGLVPGASILPAARHAVDAPQTRPQVRPCALARMRASVSASTYPRRNMRALSVGVDRVRLILQAFRGASAFNANIGAWNTASVTNMYQVRAAFSAGGGTTRPTRSIGIRCGVAVVRGGTADARACMCTQVLALACAGCHGCIYVR
jgi:surface protein